MNQTVHNIMINNGDINRPHVLLSSLLSLPSLSGKGYIV
jgi:hypothetical protein